MSEPLKKYSFNFYVVPIPIYRLLSQIRGNVLASSSYDAFLEAMKINGYDRKTDLFGAVEPYFHDVVECVEVLSTAPGFSNHEPPQDGFPGTHVLYDPNAGEILDGPNGEESRLITKYEIECQINDYIVAMGWPRKIIRRGQRHRAEEPVLF